MPIALMSHVHAWGFPWTAVYPGRYDAAVLLGMIKPMR
jgi:fatty-acyl-CoA synthase